MLNLVIGTIYVGTSASIVKKYRPNAFQGTNGTALATDLALTAVGAVTVAPVVVLGSALKTLAGVALACAAVSR